MTDTDQGVIKKSYYFPTVERFSKARFAPLNTDQGLSGTVEAIESKLCIDCAKDCKQQTWPSDDWASVGCADYERKGRVRPHRKVKPPKGRGFEI